MARFLIKTLFLFNLLIVPSCAVQEGDMLLVPQPIVIDEQPHPSIASQPFIQVQPNRQLHPSNVAAQPPIQTQPLPQPQPQPLPQPEPQLPLQPQPQPQNSMVEIAKNRTFKERYYMNRCPYAERIMAEQVKALFQHDPMVVASFIRLLFHDCFVNGCDASLLLDSTANDEKVEKISRTNGELLQGVGYIDDIKVKLEAACPQTVSCADIIAFSAMEAMALLGGPRRPYLGGRRDGMVSLASNVDIGQNMPLPEWTMDQTIQLFGRKGFTVEEMVALRGAHSVGVAHCSVFKDRLIGYGDAPGPNMPNQVVNELSRKCNPPGTAEARANPTVSFDETPTVLDNLFFRNLVEQKKALLTTDQNMLTDPRTSPFVNQFAKDDVLFKNKFADALVKVSSLDVLLGKRKGEIRKTCRSTN